jgi:putative flippase GtrA
MLSNELLLKIFKFAVVGFSSFIIDMSVTFLGKEKLRLNQYVANTCGFVCAAIFNFTLNRLWTFHSHDVNVEAQALKFMASMSFSLVIANLIIYVLNEKFKINFYVAKVMSIGISMIWNFSINNLLIFSK